MCNVSGGRCMCSARDRVGTPRKRTCSAPDRHASVFGMTWSASNRSRPVAPWTGHRRHRVASSVYGRASLGRGHWCIRTGVSEGPTTLIRQPADVAYVLKRCAPVDIRVCSSNRPGQGRVLELRQRRDAAGSRAHALGQGGERVWPSRRGRRQPSSGNVSPRSCIVTGRERDAQTGTRRARRVARGRSHDDSRWLIRVRVVPDVNGRVHRQHGMRRSRDGVVTLVRRRKEGIRGLVHLAADPTSNTAGRPA